MSVRKTVSVLGSFVIAFYMSYVLNWLITSYVPHREAEIIKDAAFAGLFVLLLFAVGFFEKIHL